MTAADGTKIAEDLQERYDSACAVADSGRNYDYTGLPVALITYKWALSSKEMIERISRAEGRARVLTEALEYYAADMEHNKFYIVTAPDRAFISDFADWGGKARAALAAPAQPQTGGSK